MQFLAFVALLCLGAIGASAYQAPECITIGAIYETFDIQPDLTLSRNDIGSQHVAAFMMAVDQINNKTDGIMDDLLPNTKIKVVTNLGQNSVQFYPPNEYFDGSDAAFTIKSNSPPDLIAVVSGASYYNTLTSCLVMNAWNIPYMIVESSSTEFSHPERFSMVLRMSPSEAFAVYPIYDVLYHFKWSRIAIFYTNDDLGVDSHRNFMRLSTPEFLYSTKASAKKAEFKREFEDYKLTVLSSHSFLPHANDMSAAIAAAKKSGARIFVVFMDALSTAKLLYSGYKSGLFEDGTQVIGTDTTLLNRLEDSTQGSLSDLWTSLISEIRSDMVQADSTSDMDMKVAAVMSEVVKGYMSVSPDPSLYLSTFSGRRFMGDLSLRPSTMTRDVNITSSNNISNNNQSSLLCSSRTDDSQEHDYLYVAKWQTGNSGKSGNCDCGNMTSNNYTSSPTSPWMSLSDSMECTGMLTTSLSLPSDDISASHAPDHVPIHPNILYSYDSVVSLAQVAHDLIAKESPVNGTSVYQHMVSITSGGNAGVSAIGISQAARTHDDSLRDSVPSKGPPRSRGTVRGVRGSPVAERTTTTPSTSTSSSTTAIDGTNLRLSTGQSLFSQGVADEDLFGRGDRYTDLGYSLFMVVSSQVNLTDYGESFARIGYWNTSYGYMSCEGSSSPLCGTTSTPVFRSRDAPYQTPSDMLPPVEMRLSHVYGVALVSVASFLLFIVAIIALFIFMARNEKCVRSSQPIMLMLMLLGCALACVKVILVGALSNIDASRCEADLWLSHVSFSCLLAPFALKLWRVDRICNQTGLKRVKVTDGTVLSYFCANLSLAVTLLSLCTVMESQAVKGGSEGRVKTLSHIESNRYYYESYCGPSASIGGRSLEEALWVYQVLNMAMAAYLTYKCRHVPTVVNETAQIAPAVIGLLSLVGTITVVELTVPLRYDTSLLLINVAYILAVYGSIVFYWFPKIKKIFETWKAHFSQNDKNHNNITMIDGRVNNSHISDNYRSNNWNYRLFIDALFHGGLRTDNEKCKELENVKMTHKPHSKTHKIDKNNELLTQSYEDVKTQCRLVMDRLSSMHHLSKDERAMFCQRQIDDWRAMLMQIADDSSNNSNSNSNGGINSSRSQADSSASSSKVYASTTLSQSKIIPVVMVSDTSEHESSNLNIDGIQDEKQEVAKNLNDLENAKNEIMAMSILEISEDTA